jgi:DGQHR domain-containing protein
MTTIPMTRFRQDARELFVGSMRAADVIRLGRVAEWKNDGGDGYQRAPERARITKIAKFLVTEPVPLLPTSVLLSHRGAPLPKTELAPDVVAIDLEDHDVLWIVDGQHRVAGLKKAIEEDGVARLADFRLPVVLMEFEDVEEEAHQFQLINENMKKVNTDLARRLLAMRLAKGGAEARKQIKQSRRLWEAESIEVLEALQGSPGSVWYGKIQPPNTKKTSAHVVRSLSFSTSLRPILTDDLTNHLGLERITALLANYWEAWRVVAPEAFADPEDYVIQKTPGVFSLHLVAKYLMRIFFSRNVTAPSVDEIRIILEDAGEAAASEFWRSGNSEGAALAGGMAGFKMLADSIIETLQDNGQNIT